MRTLCILGLALGWAQDSIRARAYLRGDYVEVAFEWRGQSGQVPLGANFVLTGMPASAVGWQLAEITHGGRWHRQSSPLYHPLYITARAEGAETFRLSLNMIANEPPAGEPFSGAWEAVGTWRAPVLHFGDTLHLRWGMETGEIVIAPFIRAKGAFTFLPLSPLHLCPAFPELRLVESEGTLHIDGLADFRPENLTIRWFRNGISVHEGERFIPVVDGAYHAEVRHRCGSQTLTDTLFWRTTSTTVQERGGWRLYPNPTSGTLWLESPGAGTFTVRIYDVAGRCLLTHTGHTTSQEAYQLVLPSLAMGTYRLTIASQDEILTFPLVYAP